MVDILRLGVVYTLGLTLICISLYRTIKWKRTLSSPDRARCCGTVTGFDQKRKKGHNVTGYVYRLAVKYHTQAGAEISAVSKNSIQSPKEYSIGAPVEISYLRQKPESFYICNDRSKKKLNRFIFLCGLFVCVMGTVLVRMPQLFQ